jgi:PAS domain S-box-containing protein
MILSLIGLVLLTAAAAGLPAIWLIQGQLDRQAWAQVEQGSRAAQALYTAQQSELISLATLTAQRPTLGNLLSEGDPVSTEAYLRTLQMGAGLDLVLICGSDQQVEAQAGKIISHELCAVGPLMGFYSISAEGAPQVWFLAEQPIAGEGIGWQGTVIVGVMLEDEFAAQMRAQTGLEHTLLVDSHPAATSLGGGVASHRLAQFSPIEGGSEGTFALNGHPYYATRFSLPSPVQSNAITGPELQAEVALEVADVVTTRRNLARTLTGSIVFIAILGSLLGAFLARRISSPLARLTDAATMLSQGNLESSVAINARVGEVALVAQALDSARIDLKRTLTELREEKAWIDHLLESVVEGIMTMDQQSRITFFSKGAERITGWRHAEVVNQSCDEVFRVIEADKPFSQFIPPPGRRHKITIALANGHEATLAITGAQLVPPESGNAQVALVFRDVSEEEAIHRLMGHFMANIAHEFRTPLSALAASIELLLDQSPDLSPAELQELLNTLHLGILGLQTLVGNLLESASIEAGRFRVNPRPSDLGKIIAEAIRTMQPLLDKRGQRLVVELPAAIPVVRADSRRTVQVLVNLLSNASKYGPDDTEITIGATLRDGWARITVADRGPGIPPEYRKDVFRRFVYPDTDGDKTQYGAGLGLSVVKAVVEAQGGQVGLEDRTAGGSIFWFTLPIETEP